MPPKSKIRPEKIYLAPRSNETSHDNLTSTIKQGIPYSRVEPFLNEEGKKVLNEFSRVYAWGNQDSGRGKGSWDDMRPDDLVLFYVKGKFIYSGRVLYKQYSADLSDALWGRSEKFNNKPWSCVFFLRDIRVINLPISDIAKFAEYNMDRVMGFQSLNEKGTNEIKRLFGDFETFLSAYQIGMKPAEAAIIDRVTKTEAASPNELVLIDDVTRGRELNDVINEYTRLNADKTPEEVEARVVRLKRNYDLVKKLKTKYENKCQIEGCGFTFKMVNGNYYSEAAHIIAISKRLPGLDIEKNILILCPNHHKMLDYGAMSVLDEDTLQMEDKFYSILRK